VADDSDGRQAGDREYTEKGKSFGAIVAGTIAVAAVVFILQNSQEETVEFLFFSATVPMSLVIIISMVLGATLGWVFSYMRRRKRRRQD
jgi:uncharacterized integral membrane protein